MTSFLRKLPACARFLRSRAFLLSVLSVVIALIILKISELTSAVYIHDGEKVSLAWTFKRDPAEILSQNNITTMAVDVVDFSGFSGKVAEIEIRRAFPVTVTCDGLTRNVQMVEGTVEELLAKAGITLGEHDTVNYPLSHLVTEGEHIIVTRITYTSYTEEEVIPCQVEYEITSLRGDGWSRVIHPGQDGKRVLTYRNYVIDGVVQETTLVDNEIVVQPINRRILQGQDGATCSQLDFDLELDENGLPVHYKTVLHNQITTGYSSSRARPTGASGQRLVTGSVAVRAADIPYGTRMYIVSADGQFVYGRAVAADTGTGLMAGVIDIDLYFDSYLESVLTGRRLLDVYILE